MPIKFKPSQKIVQRGTKVVTTQHYYIKSMSKESLFEAINDNKVKPKVRRKCIVELERRGVKIVWKTEPKPSLV